jgi:hypothetical protein
MKRLNKQRFYEKKVILLKLDNLIVTDNDAVSHALNGHFTTMRIQPAADNASHCTTLLYQVRNDIIWSGTNALEIEEVNFDLKNSVSMKVDGISLSLLKYCMADDFPSIIRILSRLFETAVVPVNMKKSKVIPVFKSGDRTDPDNYRPISVIPLPLVSKFMEKIVFKRLTGFFSVNYSLFLEQYMDLFKVRVRSALFFGHSVLF